MRKVPRKKRAPVGPSSLFFPAACLFPFAVYLACLGPCFLDGDSPETVTAGATLGIPHPPGYALSILSTRLFTLLPLGNPAFAAALGSALWASLAFLLLMGLLRAASQRPGPLLLPAFAGALLAFSPHFWQEALSPKGAVYTLQALLFLLFLWVFLKPHRASGRTGAFLFGLGLANHWPLQLPLIPLLYWMGNPLPRPKQVLAAASFLCLGLSPLLALPLLAHLGPALDLGAPDSLSRLADYLSRKVYSSSRELYEGWASWAFLRERVLHLVGHFLAFPGILALPLGLLGFLKAVGRMRALAIPLGLLLAILGLYPSVPETFWTLDRFLLPADILLCLFAGLGVRELAAGFAVRRRVLLAWVLGLLLLLGTAAQIPGKFLQGQTLRYDYAANLLKAAPRNSLLFGEADEDAFPLYYFQEVLGKRKDVRMIPSFLLFEDWGVSHFSRHFPELGLSGPQAFPQDPIGRLGGAVSDLWVRNRGKRPIVFSRFQGALHLYVLPAYPSLRYRPLGLLGALEASGLGRASAPGDLRLRHWDGLASNRDPSLEGIRRAYLDLGLAPSAPVEPGP